MVATYIKNTMNNNLCDSGVYLQEMINTFLSGFTLECELSEHICSSSFSGVFFFFFWWWREKGTRGIRFDRPKLIHLHVPDTASLCVSVSRMFDVIKW